MKATTNPWLREKIARNNRRPKKKKGRRRKEKIMNTMYHEWPTIIHHPSSIIHRTAKGDTDRTLYRKYSKVVFLEARLVNKYTRWRRQQIASTQENNDGRHAKTCYECTNKQIIFSRLAEQWVEEERIMRPRGSASSCSCKFIKE